ncbi:hypothetical protein EDB85DRAFT_1887623 [Lactarius pseudohatsudake]|nr:hypothetical protein EDB85DRAFT_1887623 [Lactarius pseudohatsudake]
MLRHGGRVGPQGGSGKMAIKRVAHVGPRHTLAWWWSGTVRLLPVGVVMRSWLRRCWCGRLEGTAVLRRVLQQLNAGTVGAYVGKVVGQFEDVATAEVREKWLCNTNEKWDETKRRRKKYLMHRAKAQIVVSPIFVPANGVAVVPLAWAMGVCRTTHLPTPQIKPCSTKHCWTHQPNAESSTHLPHRSNTMAPTAAPASATPSVGINKLGQIPEPYMVTPYPQTSQSPPPPLCTIRKPVATTCTLHPMEVHHLPQRAQPVTMPPTV